MATDFTEETAADAVVDSFAKTPDPRLRELLSSLVRHLHAFVRETEPTIAEWERAIEFLTATGQKCDDERQEFILLSDVLGISMLVETINNRKSGGATESTVLGPFHVVKSPRRELGESIDFVGTGTPCVVIGRVLSADGAPLPGAELDVWQASDQGFYDVQQPDVQPRANGRGLFTADADGAFWFRTIVPSHYPIPTDGPVGTLLLATERHPYRPAHIHFIVTAPGRHAAAGDRTAPVPPGAHPFHRDRSRAPGADHAHFRGGQPVHRIGRGVRGQEEPDQGIHPRR